MGDLAQRTATRFYRSAAWGSAKMLATSPIVESVMARRSVGTGEVAFGRSDIDLLVVIRQSSAHDGQALADFYRLLRICRLLNPALGHLHVHDPEGLDRTSAIDTSFASVERRSCFLLHGQGAPMRERTVLADHAVSRFCWGIQTLLSPAIHQGGRRYVRKAVLDSWSEYATACGVMSEPCVTRSDAERRFREAGECARPEDLFVAPLHAAAYVLELAARLHRERLPGLGRLGGPLVYEAKLPPRYTLRKFLVVPDAAAAKKVTSLPSNVFLCTAEALDLYLHYTNAFLYWNLPRELKEIGIRPPSTREFLQSAKFYSQGYFLRIPGFLSEAANMPTTTTASVAHAMSWLSREEIPPPIATERIEEAAAAASSCDAYYRKCYDRVYRENVEIWRSIAALGDGGL